MKVIFLDIDGVLNDNYYIEYSNLDKPEVVDTCLEHLKKIVDSTGAVIVLNSYWNEACIRGTEEGTYLKNCLASAGLEIIDYTKDFDICHMGKAIRNWLAYSSNKIDSWIVLDSVIFKDYMNSDIIQHCVKTNPRNGLCEQQIQKAIAMLGNNQLDGATEYEAEQKINIDNLRCTLKKVRDMHPYREDNYINAKYDLGWRDAIRQIEKILCF